MVRCTCDAPLLGVHEQGCPVNSIKGGRLSMQLDEAQYQDKYRSIPWLDDNSISLSELIHFMVQNDIPLGARIQYEGCGSHSIEFWWKEAVVEPEPQEELVEDGVLRL